MAKTTKGNSIIIMDDEPYNLEWLFDFLEAKGFEVMTTSNVTEAIDLISTDIYRAVILDLNVPVPPEAMASVSKLGGAYLKYPGLYVAREARNKGYRDRQVIIYSVHRDAEVSEEAAKLGCNYILKGRPIELKHEILSVVEYDPTDNLAQNPK
jgi:CheY-like chemotaxis protein